MRHCADCGKEMPEGLKVCKYCGTQVTIATATTQASPVIQHPLLPPSPCALVPPGFAVPASTRPTGVTIIAVLEFIAGIASVMTGLLFLFSGVSISIVSIVRGAADLATGWGLWTQMKWGWTTAIVLAVISIVIALLRFSASSMEMIVLEVALSGIILYYLTRPHIRAVFH